jgi:hypothetical protein
MLKRLIPVLSFIFLLSISSVYLKAHGNNDCTYNCPTCECTDFQGCEYLYDDPPVGNVCSDLRKTCCRKKPACADTCVGCKCEGNACGVVDPRGSKVDAGTDGGCNFGWSCCKPNPAGFCPVNQCHTWLICDGLYENDPSGAPCLDAAGNVPQVCCRLKTPCADVGGQCIDGGRCEPQGFVPAGGGCAVGKSCCKREDLTEKGKFTDLLYTGPKITSLMAVITPVAKILYYGGLFIGMCFIVYAGYVLMTSEGNPQRTQEGQEQLTAAILGIAFILLSSAILRVIITSVLGY